MLNYHIRQTEADEDCRRLTYIDSSTAERLNTGTDYWLLFLLEQDRVGRRCVTLDMACTKIGWDDIDSSKR